VHSFTPNDLARGAEMRRHRENLHLTRAELATKIGFSPPTIYNMERGMDPSPSYLRAWERFLAGDAATTTAEQTPFEIYQAIIKLAAELYRRIGEGPHVR
jgi:DNA-binding XRE family transcriptional regulator